jgi:hypothetical protein
MGRFFGLKVDFQPALGRWRSIGRARYRPPGFARRAWYRSLHPYRSMIGPLLNFIVHTQERHPPRAIALVIPALAEAR